MVEVKTGYEIEQERIKAEKRKEELQRRLDEVQAEITEKTRQHAAEILKRIEEEEREKEGTAITPIEQRIVVPQISVEEHKQYWDKFQKIKTAVITRDDIQNIQGKDYIKKSGWRKISTIFNISTAIRNIKIEYDKDNVIIRAEATVRAIAPNGRYADAVGVCSIKERKFAHEEHDIPAMATVRATNRAICDLVGCAEVSAEEM